MKKSISLGEHFTYSKLIRFAMPSIIMMVFSSIYSIVDGFFVSNFAGEAAFAGLNFVFPYCMIITAFCFMIGSGGSALIGKLLGEGNKEKANQVFSLAVYFSIVVSLIMAGIGLLLIEPITELRNASGELLEQSLIYGRIYLCGSAFFTLQMEFQNFFVTAEKPNQGFIITIAAGITNIVLDALFIIGLQMGVAGAALGTILAQAVAAICGVVYFSRKNSSLLKLGKTKFYGRDLAQMCYNGISELLSNIAMAVMGLLYNNQLLKYAGEDGVSAYGVIMYVSFIYIAIFIGYVIGVAPIISYHYGAKNKNELSSILKKSIIMIFIVSLAQFIIAESLSGSFSRWFVGYDKALLELTHRAFLIYSFGFLFVGFCIFFSSFFTALNDGTTSAIISFSRTLIFPLITVLLLPLWMDTEGIWLSYVVSEALSLIVGLFFLIKKKNKYGYGFLKKKITNE